MKKLTLLLTAAFFIGNAAYAQYIDVTKVYFSTTSNQTALDDTTLEKGATVTLRFDFQNNLSGNQDLSTGDSLTFGYSINGVDKGILNMSELGSNVANGSTVHAFLEDNYDLPNTYDSSFTVCAWPLYNPYAANTDPMNGRSCTDFKTEEDPNQTGGPTTGIEAVDAQNRALFFVNNRSVSYAFQSEHASNRISLIDLTGKEVMNAAVGAEGTIELGQEIPAGFYILSAKTATDQLVQKVLVD